MSEFQNPTAPFRGKPFWAWNCKLDKQEALTQLEYFKAMGMGGATIHCRTGLDPPYMGVEFLDTVKAAVQTAKELDLQIALYDYDR